MSKATPSFSSSAASFLAKPAWASAGSAVTARIDDLQADRGVGAGRRVLGQEVDPAACARPSRRAPWRWRRRARSAPAGRRSTPPSSARRDSPRRTSIEGVLMVAPSKMPSIELAALGHAEELRQRPGRRVALQPLDRARREDQHAVRRLAAQRLLPGEGDDIELGPVELLREGGARWRRRSSGPARSAAIKSPFGTRTPEVVPFQVKTRSASGRPWRGRAARRRRPRATSASLSFSCLTTSVTQSLPKLSKASRWTGRAPEQRPHRHLDGAGVGGRHDADQVVGRDLQHLAGAVDGVLELRLAELGAVRAAEQRRR